MSQANFDSIRDSREMRDLLSIVRKVDADGWTIAVNYLDEAETEQDEREVACDIVRAQWEARLENESPQPEDAEEKSNALDRLDRAAFFDREAFLGTLREVIAYTLRDIHPDEGR